MLSLLPMASCRFQDLTPGSTRHEEQAVQAAVVAFYQSVASRQADALAATALPDATALMAAGNTAVLIPLRSMIELPERRNQDGGARVVRSDLHVEGDIASERAVVLVRAEDEVHEYEATDLLTLARHDHSWRVAQVALGSWHTRSGP